MDNHINFVDKTYETLRSPLNYIQAKFSALTGNEVKELPLIEMQELPQIQDK